MPAFDDGSSAPYLSLGSCDPNDAWGSRDLDHRAPIKASSAEEFACARVQVDSFGDRLGELIACNAPELVDGDSAATYTATEVLDHIRLLVGAALTSCSNQTGDKALGIRFGDSLSWAIEETADGVRHPRQAEAVNSESTPSHPKPMSTDQLSYTDASNTSRAEASVTLEVAITDIDNRFGKGYAKKHPEVLSAYLQASATIHAAWISKAEVI